MIYYLFIYHFETNFVVRMWAFNGQLIVENRINNPLDTNK